MFWTFDDEDGQSVVIEATTVELAANRFVSYYGTNAILHASSSVPVLATGEEIAKPTLQPTEFLIVYANDRQRLHGVTVPVTMDQRTSSSV